MLHNKNLIHYSKKQSKLNTPINNNEYLLRLIGFIGFMLFTGYIFGSSTLTTILSLALTCYLFIVVRKRLIDIGWSKWLALICLSQLLVLVPAGELGATGQLLFYFIFPGFLVSLYFIKSRKV